MFDNFVPRKKQIPKETSIIHKLIISLVGSWSCHMLSVKYFTLSMSDDVLVRGR